MKVTIYLKMVKKLIPMNPNMTLRELEDFSRLHGSDIEFVNGRPHLLLYETDFVEKRKGEQKNE